MATKKIGRDSGTGQFIPVEKAKKDKEGATVETIKIPPPVSKKTPKKSR